MKIFLPLPLIILIFYLIYVVFLVIMKKIRFNAKIWKNWMENLYLLL